MIVRAAPRSYLYVPGDSAEKLAGVLTRNADAVIVDLEDGVVPGNKVIARDAARQWIGALPPGERRTEIWVRINPWPEGADDLESVVSEAMSGICVPKVGGAPELHALDAALRDIELSLGIEEGSVRVQPMIETAHAVIDVLHIAGAPRVERLQLGEADLAADLGATPGPDGTEMLLARSQVVLASAGAGLGAPVASVHVRLDDSQEFAQSTRSLKRLGFGSRACIHPSQVLAANEVFTPTPQEIEHARGVVTAFAEALDLGVGVVASADRTMIDEAVVRSARLVLARAEAYEGGAGRP
ncbi:MAG: Citrate (pro-3S)-lyase [Acidimicrobiaceae bacterium]|nr:Citrate (pro-3S)-lyase [Acidimicrobiaceae bacterium]